MAAAVAAAVAVVIVVVVVVVLAAAAGGVRTGAGCQTIVSREDGLLGSLLSCRVPQLLCVYVCV